MLNTGECDEHAGVRILYLPPICMVRVSATGTIADVQNRKVALIGILCASVMELADMLSLDLSALTGVGVRLSPGVPILGRDGAVNGRCRDRGLSTQFILCAGLTQRLEFLFYTQGVEGSSPSSSTNFALSVRGKA